MLISLFLYNMRSFIASNFISLTNVLMQLISFAVYLSVMYLALFVEMETVLYFLLL